MDNIEKVKKILHPIIAYDCLSEEDDIAQRICKLPEGEPPLLSDEEKKELEPVKDGYTYYQEYGKAVAKKVVEEVFERVEGIISWGEYEEYKDGTRGRDGHIMSESLDRLKEELIK